MRATMLLTIREGVDLTMAMSMSWLKSTLILLLERCFRIDKGVDFQHV